MVTGELCHAYVLHARPYKEKSRLLDVWTLEHGRISATGKPKVPLFQPCLLSLRGKSSLKTLASSEVAGLPLTLTGNALLAGFYLNELLVRLLPPEEPTPELFALYGEVLTGMQATDALEPCLRRFEQALLASLGYALSLRTDAHGDPVQPLRTYRYAPEWGLLAVDNGWPGTALLAMAADDWQERSTRQVAKQLLRQALAVQLGDKPLKSRELWLGSKQQ